MKTTVTKKIFIPKYHETSKDHSVPRSLFDSFLNLPPLPRPKPTMSFASSGLRVGTGRKRNFYVSEGPSECTGKSSSARRNPLWTVEGRRSTTESPVRNRSNVATTKKTSRPSVPGHSGHPRTTSRRKEVRLPSHSTFSCLTHLRTGVG